MFVCIPDYGKKFCLERESNEIITIKCLQFTSIFTLYIVWQSWWCNLKSSDFSVWRIYLSNILTLYYFKINNLLNLAPAFYYPVIFFNYVYITETRRCIASMTKAQGFVTKKIKSIRPDSMDGDSNL